VVAVAVELVEQAVARGVPREVGRGAMSVARTAHAVLGTSGTRTALTIAIAGATAGHASPGAEARAKAGPETGSEARARAAAVAARLLSAFTTFAAAAFSVAIAPTRARAGPGAWTALIAPFRAAFGAVARARPSSACLAKPAPGAAATSPFAAGLASLVAWRLVIRRLRLVFRGRRRCLGDQQRGPGPQTGGFESRPPNA
jgi:hypothetical protein